MPYSVTVVKSTMFALSQIPGSLLTLLRLPHNLTPEWHRWPLSRSLGSILTAGIRNGQKKMIDSSV